MKILSVRNHHLQQQYRVLDPLNTKTNDWVKPLTPPANNSTLSPSNGGDILTNDNVVVRVKSAATHNYRRVCNDSRKEDDDDETIEDYKLYNNDGVYLDKETVKREELIKEDENDNNENIDTKEKAGRDDKALQLQSIDEVDGQRVKVDIDTVDGWRFSSFSTRSRDIPIQQQKQPQQQKQQQYERSPMICDLLAPTPYTESGNCIDYHLGAASTPSPASSTLSTPTEATELFGLNQDQTSSYDQRLVYVAAIGELSQRLQTELRAAKKQHFPCTEVSLPWDLTSRIAADMIRTSEREPCGMRGCAIFIDFQDETGHARRISAFKIEPNTVSTFELYLTLKQDTSGWTSLLPQFLKNLTRGSTILISPHFTLNKHKIYACE